MNHSKNTIWLHSSWQWVIRQLRTSNKRKTFLSINLKFSMLVGKKYFSIKKIYILSWYQRFWIMYLNSFGYSFLHIRRGNVSIRFPKQRILVNIKTKKILALIYQLKVCSQNQATCGSAQDPLSSLLAFNFLYFVVWTQIIDKSSGYIFFIVKNLHLVLYLVLIILNTKIFNYL